MPDELSIAARKAAEEKAVDAIIRECCGDCPRPARNCKEPCGKVAAFVDAAKKRAEGASHA